MYSGLLDDGWTAEKEIGLEVAAHPGVLFTVGLFVNGTVHILHHERDLFVGVEDMFDQLGCKGAVATRWTVFSGFTRSGAVDDHLVAKTCCHGKTF